MKKFLSLTMIFSVMVLSLAVCTTVSAASSGALDYSQKASWCRLPSIITKDIDTFYIYSTSYVETSFREGAPDYASLDTSEMVERAQSEYVDHATVYEDSTNVFVPYYRQAGMRYAGEVSAKTGTIDAALLGKPYDDIAAALGFPFGLSRFAAI